MLQLVYSATHTILLHTNSEVQLGRIRKNMKILLRIIREVWSSILKTKLHS